MESRVLEMLPWYVNGTLGENERREVESQLPIDASLRNEAEFLRNLRKAVQEAAPVTSPDFGQERLRRLIAAETLEQAPPPKPKVAAGGAGWIAGIRRLLAWFVGAGLRPKHVYAFASLAIILQAGFIGYLVVDREAHYSEFRSRPHAPPAVGPFIRVSFKPDAKESDIRFLLISIGAAIVGGPSQLGDYYLYVDAARTDWAVQQIRQSDKVDAANVIATLPAAKE